ncbi:MAG: hypothetical protein QOI93_865, partial [Rhodospirillaceae bacterium]|nr:hypothetical protein [Rhodospirillaceae bacterium]
PPSPLTAGFWWVMPLIYLSASLPAGPTPVSTSRPQPTAEEATPEG